MKRSKSQPLKLAPPIYIETTEKLIARQTVEKRVVGSVDDMSYPQVMEMLRSIISQKADPNQCYFYIDDEKTVRLDKLLSLPNSFEVKRAKPTEKEKEEKLKRKAIELYYNNGA